MNRKQRRAFVKKAQSKGVSKSSAEDYISIKEVGLDGLSLPKQFQEGDWAKLDVEKIMKPKYYKKMNPKYKEFVESNADKVFTVHLEQGTLISFKEQPEWLFWSGNLIKVNGDMNRKQVERREATKESEGNDRD